MKNSTILIIDDEPEILNLFENNLNEKGYYCLSAQSAKEGLKLLESIEIDLVICDFRLEETNGIEFLQQVAELWPSIIRMMISGNSEMEIVIEAVNRGHIHAFFTKPLDFNSLMSEMNKTLIVSHSVKIERRKSLAKMVSLNEQRDMATAMFQSLASTAQDAIIIINQQENITFWNRQAELTFGYKQNQVLGENMHNLLIPDGLGYREKCRQGFRTFIENGGGKLINTTNEVNALRNDGVIIPIELSINAIKLNGQWHAMGIARDISERKAVDQKIIEQANQYHQALLDTVFLIGKMVEKRDPYTSGHQSRVAQLATAIAIDMELPARQIEGISLGAAIHDIGKIYIPAEILNRSGKLTPEEFKLVKTHSQVGYDILKDAIFPWPLAQMVCQHHERLDGSGYPNGLVGSDILLEAQLIAVADVVEAITSHRPYRQALGLEFAINEIKQHKHSRYNANAVDSCIKLIESGHFTFV